MDNKLSFVCRVCDKLRYGSEPIMCGHKASDYSLAEPVYKPEEKPAPFVEEDLEGLPDPKGFKSLFSPENDTDGGLKL